MWKLAGLSLSPSRRYFALLTMPVFDGINTHTFMSQDDLKVCLLGFCSLSTDRVITLSKMLMSISTIVLSWSFSLGIFLLVPQIQVHSREWGSYRMLWKDREERTRKLHGVLGWCVLYFLEELP